MHKQALRDASPLLAELHAVKTAAEIARIERSAAVAREGFLAARAAVRVGATEADVAAAVLAALTRAGYRAVPGERVLPHVHVMAGPRAARAYRAYNLTSAAAIQRGDRPQAQSGSPITPPVVSTEPFLLSAPVRQRAVAPGAAPSAADRPPADPVLRRSSLVGGRFEGPSRYDAGRDAPRSRVPASLYEKQVIFGLSLEP